MHVGDGGRGLPRDAAAAFVPVAMAVASGRDAASGGSAETVRRRFMMMVMMVMVIVVLLVPLTGVVMAAVMVTL